MKLRDSSFFVAGALVTAVLVGTVGLVDASSGRSLTACANKSSGAMRFISKGKCRSTERQLIWNTAGPTGSQGAQGAPGKDGVNGQNLRVIDAAGRDLGIAYGLIPGGSGVGILYEGGLWSIGMFQNSVDGNLLISDFYADSACTQPLIATASMPGISTIQPQLRGQKVINSVPKYFKPSTSAFLFESRVVYAEVRNSCVASTESSFKTIWGPSGSEANYEGFYFVEGVEVQPPAYTAPYRIVSQ